VSNEDEQPDELGMIRLQVWIPRAWLVRLQELAADRAVSVSAVLRIFLRDALYERPLPWRKP
jgi:hypothetical protein